MEKIVIIPTYNERDNIEKILRAVYNLQQDFHVLVIDDGSPDGTADVVRSLMHELDGTVFLEERRGKLGLGTAYIHGFKWATKRGYEFIFEMDADFSHDPADLPRLIDALSVAVSRFPAATVSAAAGSNCSSRAGWLTWPSHRAPLPDPRGRRCAGDHILRVPPIP